MLSLARLSNIGTIRIAARSIRSYSDFKPPKFTQSVPFQDDLGGDPKYQSFNNMYTDMFTVPEAASNKPLGVASVNGEAAYNEEEDLDAINKEILEFFEPPETSPQFKNILNAGQLKDMVSRNGRFVIKSLSNNPYFNLALEDYVFEKTPKPDNSAAATLHNQRLLFYINSKCCVIGKNQNPWKELHLKNLNQRGVPFLRRRSGGGCVAHDLGNVNYSFLTTRDAFDKTFFNELIVEALKSNDSIGVTQDLKLNERGDITLNGYKVSGSAFKIAKNKSYHHGTMLISSDLPAFKDLLKPDDIVGEQWDCNSVESVRSHICNLKDYQVMSQVEEFTDLITKSFQDYYFDEIEDEDDSPAQLYYCDESVTEIPEIKLTMQQLQSDELKFQSTPRFKVTYNDAEWYEVEKGVVVSSSETSAMGQPFMKL